MDEVANYNRERWKALNAADALFTRPQLELDIRSAGLQADPHQRLGDIRGLKVLCLGGGGGKQSVAFGLLGADVTVADLSPEQLEGDRLAAERHGLAVRTVEADMRDLSVFAADSFDIVDQPYSINLVPDCRGVFRQVAAVLRPRGRYRVVIANPIGMGVRQSDWNDGGYSISEAYIDGARLTWDDQEWVYDRGLKADVPKPVEYRQTLGRVLNGLIDLGFRVEHFSETIDIHPDVNGEPGTWDHYVAFVPPWFSILARLEN
ncbi:MAG: class I SAM-dependent methyltransferase [Pyrinomonadaceae bacterium]